MEVMDGFKVDVRSEECARLLQERATLLETKALEVEEKDRKSREKMVRELQEQAQEFGAPRGIAALGHGHLHGHCGPDLLREIAAGYREQARAMRFTAEHVIPGQTYRLPISELGLFFGPVPTEAGMAGAMRYPHVV